MRLNWLNKALTTTYSKLRERTAYADTRAHTHFTLLQQFAKRKKRRRQNPKRVLKGSNYHLDVSSVKIAVTDPSSSVRQLMAS